MFSKQGKQRRKVTLQISNFINERRGAVNIKDFMQFNANVKFGMLEIAVMNLLFKRA